MLIRWKLFLPGRLARGGPARFSARSLSVFLRVLGVSLVSLSFLSPALAVQFTQATQATLATQSTQATQSSTPALAGKTATKKKKSSASRTRRQLAPEPARIKEIQQALAREGFYQGEPTGKWDDATVAAMKNFQQSKGLQPTGKIEALSLQKLGLGSPVAGLAAPALQATPPVAPPPSKPPDKP